MTEYRLKYLITYLVKMTMRMTYPKTSCSVAKSGLAFVFFTLYRSFVNMMPPRHTSTELKSSVPSTETPCQYSETFILNID